MLKYQGADTKIDRVNRIPISELILCFVYSYCIYCIVLKDFDKSFCSLLRLFIQTENNRPERKSSMVKREYMNKSWSRSERRLTDISDSDVQREPDPDYSPRLRRKVRDAVRLFRCIATRQISYITDIRRYPRLRTYVPARRQIRCARKSTKKLVSRPRSL